ncbi:hypothetical protein G9P44_002677 [Scheffersomyces stipitis]|nr:hypothetical protein G9P44_002677 [Scheffersomyces stipitis]
MYSKSSSVSPDPEDDHEAQEKKRLRTKTACDYCRKRKSKCNGENPCSNCLTHSKDCTYTVVPKVRKKRVSKSSSNSKDKKHNPNSIQGLNSRLSTLEGLLSKLVKRLDSKSLLDLGNSRSGDKDDDSSDTVSLNSLPSESNSEDEQEEEDFSKELVLNEKSSVSSPEKLKQMLQPCEPRSCQIVTSARDRILQYFGSHSMFCIFSAKSIKWMKGRIEGKGDDSLLLPIRNLPYALNSVVQSNMKVWAQSLPTSPSNSKFFFNKNEKNLIFELLEYYYDDINIAPYLCSLHTIRELFQLYFYALSSHDVDILNGISQSEFLIMNVSIALCLTNKSGDVKDNHNFPALSAASSSDLAQFKQKMFSNAVACYERVSVVCEGIRTIQGIALVTLYIEASFITDFQINHMLVSVMVRFACDLGLHSTVSVSKYDAEEHAHLKRRLWWFCEYMDSEVCYRSGKATLINRANVTILTEEDDYFLSVPLDPFKNDVCKKNSSELVANCRKWGYQNYYIYYTLMLCRLKEKSYNNLFKPQVAHQSQEELLKSLQDINEDMFRMARLMEPEIRPTLYYVKRPESPSRSCFAELSESNNNFFQYSSLLLQLSFFAHLLSINRVPFMNNMFESNEKTIKFGNLSLESARTILHLVVDLDRTKVPNSILNWVTFYPFMAYCSLIGHCLSFPQENSTHMDCTLLIRVSLNFFAYRGLNEEDIRTFGESKTYDNKSMMYDLITRLLLRVLVNLMDKESEHHYANEIKGLSDHMEACANIYPDLFKKTEGKKPMNLLFSGTGLSQSIFTHEEFDSYAIDSPSLGSFDTPLSQSSKSTAESQKTLVNSEQQAAPDSQPSLSKLIDPSESDLDFGQMNEEAFNSLISSQLYTLPNFFFDGNYEYSNSENDQGNDFDYYMN